MTWYWWIAGPIVILGALGLLAAACLGLALSVKGDT